MRAINRIIVHCAATRGDVSAETIERWHKTRGFREIGYHGVIRTDGTYEPGRQLKHVGAHCRGFNEGSIGLCLAGGGDGTPNYTAEQWETLELVVIGFCGMFKIIDVAGHNNFTNLKTCPNFDVRDWFDGVRQRIEANL